MTAKINPESIKMEPEEESKINLCVTTQRYLILNNDVKEEVDYNYSNTNFGDYNNHFVMCQNKDNIPSRLYGSRNNNIKEEVGYGSSNTILHKFEDCVGDPDSNFVREKLNLNKNSTNFVASSAIQCDQFNSNKLTRHCQKGKSDFKYKCEQCDYSTKRKSNLNFHRDGVHKGVKYKCAECDYTTHMKRNLATHCATHKDINYKCEECDFSTKCKSSLSRHRDGIHKGIKYKCDECDYSTKRKSHLNRHYDGVHKGIKYKCDHCDYSTHMKRNLTSHSVKHKGTIYICDQCYYSSVYKPHFNRHYDRVHKGIKSNVTNVGLQHAAKTT